MTKNYFNREWTKHLVEQQIAFELSQNLQSTLFHIYILLLETEQICKIMELIEIFNIL